MKLIDLHYRSLISSIVRIAKSPIEHLLNILIISVLIAVLSSTLVIVNNTERWQAQTLVYPQIMVYLDSGAKESNIAELQTTISRYGQKLVKNYQFISKVQGLADLSQDPELRAITSSMNLESDGANPLPDVLVVNTNSANTRALTQLTTKISKFPMVVAVHMDPNYANKVSDLIHFIQRIANFLEFLFVLILSLVVYNMIRLQMLLRQDEIIVSRLIGASNNFIMRPLVYYALVQVILSTFIAYALVNSFISFINHLFTNLNNLFGQGFLLSDLSWISLIEGLTILSIFTIFAVWLAVRWVFSNNRYTQ